MVVLIKMLSIPADATPGSYAIMVIRGDATGDNLTPIISRTYTVIPPTITLPVISRGPVGAKFRVAGEGFSVGARLRCILRHELSTT